MLGKLARHPNNADTSRNSSGGRGGYLIPRHDVFEKRMNISTGIGFLSLTITDPLRLRPNGIFRLSAMQASQSETQRNVSRVALGSVHHDEREEF